MADAEFWKRALDENAARVKGWPPEWLAYDPVSLVEDLRGKLQKAQEEIARCHHTINTLLAAVHDRADERDAARSEAASCSPQEEEAIRADERARIEALIESLTGISGIGKFYILREIKGEDRP